MTWIYAIPAWVFVPSCVIGASVLACGSLAVVRKHITRNEQIAHNDVAGPILTIIGTVLAVMMSFMTVGVWQEYDGAASTAQQEASALSDLHHIADAFPPNMERLVHTQVERYITLVINAEWPAMRRGGESVAAHDAAYRIQDTLIHWKPPSIGDEALKTRALDYTSTFLDKRRDRILANRQGIPILLWVTMLLIGAVTVMFSFYFRVDRAGAQYVMVIAETTVITIIFTLIAELDYPFRGDIAIDPYSFLHVMNSLRGILNGS